MRTLLAFWKKEWRGQLRSGKLWILGGVFLLIGLMNPVTAKLTPLLYELLADTLAQSGMTVTAVSVTALDSWTQFFKNIPIALIVFLLIESNLFTKEYQSGTLILALTKGLSRYKVLVSKAAVLLLTWTAGYWISFGVTYGVNAFFWENSIAQRLPFAAVCWWLLGLWTVTLAVLFSTVVRSNIGVLAGTGGVFFGVYLLGLLPRIGDWCPTVLMNGSALIYGAEDGEWLGAVLITVALSVVCLLVSVPILNKKQL
ncbi:MAG: ABC transporter permease subunit [Clostridia bacterium]|nr:ABC transporter permease subunit [Clostridia bacterium]